MSAVRTAMRRLRGGHGWTLVAVAAGWLLVPVLGIRVAIGPLTSAYVVRELPEAVQGSGWGLLRTVFFGVGSTGSTVVGLFADAGLFDAAFLLLSALTGVIVVFWLLLPARDGVSAAEAETAT